MKMKIRYTLLFSALLPALCVAKTATYHFKNSLESVNFVPPAQLLPGFYSDSVFGISRPTLNAGGGIQIDTKDYMNQSYTVTVVGKLSEVSGYRKILGFGKTDADSGVYSYEGQLKLYPYTVAGGALTPSEYFVLTASRDHKTRRFVAYINGEQALGIDDDVDAAAMGEMLQVFKDDEVTSGSEQAPARISLLRIIDNSSDLGRAREIYRAASGR